MENDLFTAPMDRNHITAMFARAFQDDPAFSYIFPDQTVRSNQLPKLFGLLFDSDGRAGMRCLVDCGVAATLWRRPYQARTGWGEMLRHAVPLLSTLGSSIGRALRVAHAIDMHLPPDPFWYLHYAACEPTQQSFGHGGAAIRAGLASTGQLPVYLETANEKNIAIYQRFGFAVTSQ